MSSSALSAERASQLSYLHAMPASAVTYRQHRDAFELPEESFQSQYRLTKTVIRWLCDELHEEPELRRLRRSWTVMTVKQQVLCTLRFYATCLGIRRGWIDFPQTNHERDDVVRGLQRLGRIPGVIGGVEGTMIAIVGPSENDPTVTKAAYWCRKQYYVLNVMEVCDADCRVMSIDLRYPGSVHDSFALRYSWLRRSFEQGRLINDGRFLLMLHNICLSSEEPEPEPDSDPDEPGLESGPSSNGSESSSEGSAADDERLAPAHPRPCLPGAPRKPQWQSRPPGIDTTSAKESVTSTEVPPIRDTIGDREPLIVLATVALPHTADPTGGSEPLVVLTATDALAIREALPVVVSAVTSTSTKEVIAHLLRVFHRYGAPDHCLTDHGRAFESHEFLRLIRIHGITIYHSVAYYAASNGFVERSNGTLVDVPRKLCKSDPKTWDTRLKEAAFVVNTTYNASSQFSPFALLHGYVPKMPSSKTSVQKHGNHARALAQIMGRPNRHTSAESRRPTFT
ncbi:hypothetical protein ISCGN_031355 [Ixodes scapularis]